MDIETILQTELPPEEREVLAEDRKRWKHMGAGAHLSDWLAYAPGLRIRRRLAMKVNHVNLPQGRGFVETYSQLLRLSGFDNKDKSLMHSLTAVAWLDDDLERMTVLREILDTMSPGERSRLNSPITARQRVEKVLKARAGGTEESLRVSPIAVMKQKNTEQARQIAHLEEKLAAAERRDGSLFDLKRDTVADIAANIVTTLVEADKRAKAKSIAKAVLELLDKPRPAG